MLQFYEPEKDYGTPARVATEQVTVTVDGLQVTVPAGTSVMRIRTREAVRDHRHAR